MPRTKRPVKKQEKTAEDDETLKKLNKLVTDQKNKIDSRAYMELRDVELAFKILLGSISQTYLEKTVGQLKTELALKEVTNSTRRTTTRNSSRAASHDDGYLTEGSSQSSGGRGTKKATGPPSTVSRTTTNRRSRSADASRAMTVSKQRRRSRSVYKTPAYNKNAMVNYPAITPKVLIRTIPRNTPGGKYDKERIEKQRLFARPRDQVGWKPYLVINNSTGSTLEMVKWKNLVKWRPSPEMRPVFHMRVHLLFIKLHKVTPHTPLTVLRQPRQGEMVLSMSGSPVMVPSCYAMQPDEKANCNILLQDGTMLSLQPKQLRQSQAYIPFSLMDSNVLHQLKTLKDNLDKVVKLGEKAIVK